MSSFSMGHATLKDLATILFHMAGALTQGITRRVTVSPV